MAQNFSNHSILNIISSLFIHISMKRLHILTLLLSLSLPHVAPAQMVRTLYQLFEVGKVLTNAADVQPGELLETRLAEGVLRSEVK